MASDPVSNAPDGIQNRSTLVPQSPPSAMQRPSWVMMRTFRPAHCRISRGANMRSVKFFFLVFVVALPALAVTSGGMLSYSTWLPADSVSYNAIDKSGAQYFSGDATFPCQPAAGGPQVAAGVYSVIGKLQPRGDGLAWSVCLAGTARGLYVDMTESGESDALQRSVSESLSELPRIRSCDSRSGSCSDFYKILEATRRASLCW
jgi:hypothetical protein